MSPEEAFAHDHPPLWDHDPMFCAYRKAWLTEWVALTEEDRRGNAMVYFALTALGRLYNGLCTAACLASGTAVLLLVLFGAREHVREVASLITSGDAGLDQFLAVAQRAWCTLFALSVALLVTLSGASGWMLPFGEGCPLVLRRRSRMKIWSTLWWMNKAGVSPPSNVTTSMTA